MLLLLQVLDTAFMMTIPSWSMASCLNGFRSTMHVCEIAIILQQTYIVIGIKPNNMQILRTLCARLWEGWLF